MQRTGPGSHAVGRSGARVIERRVAATQQTATVPARRLRCRTPRENRAGVGQSRQRVCAACTGPCRPESRTRTDARSAAEEDRQQRAAFRIAQNGRPRRPTSARAAEPRRVRTDSPWRRRVRLRHPFTETEAEMRQKRFA